MNRVATYTYDAWGNVIAVKDANSNLITDYSHIAQLNPIRYRGYYYDTETGFYYLGSRYYDPAVGRFINGDVFASTGRGFLGHNLYAYCLNNPIGYVDTSGSCPYANNSCDFRRLEAGLPPANCICGQKPTERLPASIKPSEDFDIVEDDSVYYYEDSAMYTKAFSQYEVDEIINKTKADRCFIYAMEYLEASCTSKFYKLPTIISLIIDAHSLLQIASYIPASTYTSTVALYANSEGNHIILTKIESAYYSEYNTGWELDYHYKNGSSLYDYAFPDSIGKVY